MASTQAQNPNTRHGDEMAEQQKIDTTQYISLLDRFWEILGVILNEDDLENEDKEKMLTRDETVKAGLKYTTNMIYSSIGRYTHPDERIDETINQAIDFSNTSIGNVLQRMIYEAQGYGYAVGEIIYTIDDGVVKVADITRLAPYQCAFKVQDDESLAIEFTTIKYGKIILPPEKCLVLRNGGGIYGESVLRPVFSSWQFKTALKKWWAVAMEKFAIPTVVAESSDPNAARAIFASWFSKAGVSVPIGDKISTLQPGSDMARSFQDSIEYLNTLIFRGLQVPQLISSSSDTGAYAMSKTHMQLFQDTMRSQATNYANQILDQLVTRLIEYNFGVQEDYGEFAINVQPSVDDKAAMAGYITALISGGVVDPTEPWIRDMLSIPEYEGAVIPDADGDNDQDGAQLRGKPNNTLPDEPVETASAGGN